VLFKGAGRTLTKVLKAMSAGEAPSSDTWPHESVSVLSLRSVLREHTAPAHNLLEASPLMQALSSGAPSAGEWRAYLVGQWRLHAPLEEALRQWVTPEWCRLRLVKSQWLRSDLLALGADTDSRRIDTPAVSSLAEALGVLYVLEGSTLGLQVLRQRFEDPLAPAAASRFVRGDGANTGRFWRLFIDRLETLPTDAWPQAVGAASATFAAFQRLFAQRP